MIFLDRLQEAGVDGVILCSLPPASFPWTIIHPEERLASVMTDELPSIYSFYWLIRWKILL